MKLSPNLVLKQQQKLIMTPELRQAIAVLQMSSLELEEFIREKLEENPFLEEKEPEQVNGKEVAESDKKEIKEDEEYNSKLATWLEYYSDRDAGYTRQDSGSDLTFENYVSRRPSLYEHLEFQLHIIDLSVQDIYIGEYIIGSIDRFGYLTASVEEIAHDLGIEPDRVQAVLEKVQSFHPHGVGARDLPECLWLQLKMYEKDIPLAKTIIDHHLVDMAKGRMNRIAQATGVNVCEVQNICDFIRNLDPKPGLQYSREDTVKYIIPDVYVEKVEGEYIVTVNESQFPRMAVTKAYENILVQPDAITPETKKYLEDKMGTALWLIRSIDQRRITLYKVSCCIVDIQREFLERGLHYLRPLTLRQVAEILGIHESTVSRAVNNKYIQTPKGLFDMKYFFTTGVQSATSLEKYSARSIKKLIENLVGGEDANKPMSDKAIAQVLLNKGIIISRRTVAKYRQEMGIASTTARKRY